MAESRVRSHPVAVVSRSDLRRFVDARPWLTRIRRMTRTVSSYTVRGPSTSDFKSHLDFLLQIRGGTK
jgi:hypothetical protein